MTSSPHRPSQQGMSLIEVMIASMILALMLGGILAGVVQSRRLTESGINANTAATIVQSYMEQLKSMPIGIMANQDPKGVAQLGSSYALTTQSDQSTNDPLQTTVGTPPAMSTLVPGTTPSGLIDNLKDVANQNGGTSTGAVTTWNAIWPRAATYSFATPSPYSGDFHLNIWVWITDLSGTSTNATSVYGITMIYTWQFQDGGRVRYGMDEIRSMRSSVPTF